MIVCHSFFYKSHPKYLNEAVGMMRSVNNCCFFRHGDFDSWVLELRRMLRETTGGRFEKNGIQLSRTEDHQGIGQVQIEVNHGLDYAARISFVIVEKALTQRIIGGDFVKLCRLDPEGNMVYNEKKE
ncbi:MAG: hypothetical protein II886_13605 [Prevotella sp.]|nr:hypothetical protein [Prevotella sp.]